MNERRVSLGNRALSLLLALVMVIGMLPLTVFAAPATDNSTTANNVAAVKTYAEDLLNDNFSLTSSKDAEFSWDKEGKDAWRYFNGVVMDALLMLGVDSDAGNALEFVSAYYNTNINSSGYIVRYGDKDIDNQELDSIRAARGLVNLLGTSMDKDKYEAALHNIYAELASFPTVSGTDGNYRHKDNWTSYEIGLDGLYMAQPFMAAYAKAIDDGLIENTKNVNTTKLYADIADRMLWVANNMSFTDASGNVLLNHGYDGDGTNNLSSTIKGNGVVWSRGVGWYLAAMVDVIELMPDTADRDALIAKLPTLFDGMLAYQHADSGMWYNVVYGTNGSDVKVGTQVSSSNYLEVSGTALIAYAMLKAYNNGWVGSTYKIEGLEAFNGMFSTKNSDGKYMVSSSAMNNIYLSAGVKNYSGMTDEYCKSGNYKEGEGKGVGPVIMAAAQASKAISAEETFVGVVDAPDMTIALGTTPSYKDVKITVAGNQGTVKTVPVTDNNVSIQAVMTTAVGDTAGNATATVYYSGDPIGTFNITVVDTTSGETGSSTISVGGNGIDPSTGTNDSESRTVEVTTTGETTTTTQYVLDTDGTIGTANPYVIAVQNGDSWIALKNDGDKGTNASVSVTNGILTFNTPSDAANSEWTVASGIKFSNAYNGKTYYIVNGNDVINTSSAANTKLYHQGNGEYAICLSGAGTYNGGRNLVYNNGWTRDDKDGGTVYLFEKVTTEVGGGNGGTTEYTITLTAGSDGELLNKGATKTLTAALSCSDSSITPSGTVVWSSNNTSVATVDSSTGVVTAVGAGSATITATVTGATVTGSDDSVNLSVDIPVTVAEATTYNVSLTVTPVNMVMEKGETTPFYAEVAITDANGSELNGWSFSNMTVSGYSDVISLDANQVTGAKAGTTSITVTLESVTDGTNTYTLASPISKTIDVTVNAPHSHSYTSAVTTAATCTTAGTRTYTCSCGNSYTETIAALGHNYENGACTICGAADPNAEPPVESTPAPTTSAPATTAPESSVTVIYNAQTGDKADGVTIGGSTNDKFADLTINGQAFTQALKIDSGGKLTYVADADGVLTFYVGTQSANREVQVKEGNTQVVSYTISKANVAESFTVNVTKGKTYVFSQESGETALYMATFASTGGNDHTHSYTSSVTTQPGCESAGVRTYTCSCGDSYTETIPATGHSYTSQEFSPNCTTDGYILYTCGNCGHTYTEPGVASQGHNYVDGECSYCGAADPNYNPGGSDTPATDEFMIPTKMENGKQYLLNNSENAARAAYWDGNSWETGAVTVTENGTTYTVTPSTGYTLLTWESKDNSATQGYFSFMNNGSKVYISGVDAVTSSKSDAAVFTVDLTNNTVKLGSSYIKIESSGGLKLYDSAQSSMRLFTPSSSGGTTDPDDPDTPSTGSTYIHNFTENDKTSSFYTISGDLSTSKGTASYNNLTLTQCLKMNGEAEITFKSAAAGTITLVFNTGSAGKKIDVNGTIYTIPSDGIVTAYVPAGNNTIVRNDGESFLYYMVFAEDSGLVVYSLSDLVFDPTSVNAGEGVSVSTTFSATDNEEHTYTIQWKVDDTVMSETGLSTGFTPMDAGEYTVTATLTHVDGEELTSPVVKTGTITVGDATVTSGTLNSTSTTVTQGTNVTLSALNATITYSNGNTSTVNLSDSGFTFKQDGSNININDVDATVGTHTIAVYYDGVSIGNLTVTVNAKVEATNAVSYVLDTDGVIEDDSEYLIVGYVDGKYYALTCNKSTTSASTVVEPQDGVINLESDVAAKLLWHFANQNSDFTSDNGVTYDCFQISNNGYYLQSGGANFSNSATSVYAAKIGESDGTYEIALKFESDLPRALYCNGTSWARDSKSEDRDRILYLYKKVEAQSAITLGNLPMLYIGGTPWQAKLSDYVTSVTYNGTTYEKGNYEIQWTSSNTAVAYITDDGQYVNGAAAGSSQLVAKLISVGGTDVSAENIVATANVYVTAPSLDLGEDVHKFVGDAAFTVEHDVLIGSTVPESYELSWNSSNESVATVNETTGEVTIVGAGSTVITAQIVSTNGNNISNYLTITDSITLNVEEIVITSGELSSDTVTVEIGATTDDLKAALSGITLTLTKNNGEIVVIDNATLFEDVDLTAVNTAAGGTYYLDVSYSDPNSDYVFSGTVTVKVFDASMIEAEGFLTQEQNVEYILDTDGIDVNEEYVIVMKNSDGEWVAMMNPDADGSGGTKGKSQVVTVGTNEDGQKIITVSKNADLVEWLFSNQGSSSSNGFSYKTFTVKNNNRYLKGGSNDILGSSSKSIAIWQDTDNPGQYYTGTDYSSGKIKALTLDGDNWTRASSSAYPDDSSARVYMYKRHSVGHDFSVAFEVQPDSKTLAEGTSYTVPASNIDVIIDGNVECTNYVIEWKSSDTDVATVDSNGKITAVGEGTATITATLMTADGYKVYSNADNTQGISDEIAITVQADQLTYTLQGSPLTVPLGGEPDFSKVSLLIDSTLSDDIVVPSDQLVFKYIDAVVGGFDTDVPNDTCTVDVYYNGKLLDQKLVLKVADNAYDGLEQATSYPEYPDPGAVRMDKFATGINFNTTGVAKIELNAAGISSRKPVDVILIVDVSNSMNWSMDWFEGMSADDILKADDTAKTDSSKDDKLDMAMTAAQSFAGILMENNVAGSEFNNSMTFVTFGGYDKDRHNVDEDKKLDAVDTVVTAFIGEETLANVNNSFANTMFTGSQTLKISGTDGEAIVSGKARGNTIYDAAFVEAIAAVEQLKIAKAGSVAKYDASGREIHIVFMTDGAPSHYNDKCYDNSNTHDKWFTKFSPSDSNTPDDTEWLNYIKNPNADATELYSMVSDFHIVGYDLAHGGFGTHNWTEAELGRVLGGLVENKALDYTLATDTEKLNAFFDELGHSLAYAGTHALVTDIVSEEFILQTDPIDLYGDGSEMLAPTIEIVERQLVVRTDIGKTMNIQGVGTVPVAEEHLGMYVVGGEKILATVSFDTTDASNKKAYSTALDDSEDIWNDTTNIITGKYFTYSFSSQTFEWKIGNIEDTEIALTYYGYLTGAKNAAGEGGRAEGIYATNEEATLKYINTDNQIVTREYPVPRIAWGKASATVRFFLVNEEGEYTNLAGNTFTNPANRVFLVNSATYQFDLNTDSESLVPGIFTAQDAFGKAEVSNQYALYDDVTMSIANSTMQNVDGYAKITAGADKSNTEDLVEFIDVNGDGSYIQAVINVPVVATGRLGTNTPLTEETVVLDYAKPIDVQLFNHNELLITNYGYKMELYGFAAFDPAFDTKLYLLENEYSGKYLAEGAYFDAGFGHFKIIKKDTGLIEFHPTSIAQGPVQVFAIAKITQLANEANVYYLYNPVTIVPATTVYYETDFADGHNEVSNITSPFITAGTWNDAAEGNSSANLQDADPDVNRRDDVMNNIPHAKDQYGFDSSYANSNLLSGGTSLKAAGAGVDATIVTFSFTGTGFDIISRTGKDQGMIRVNVTDSEGNLVKTVRVTNQGTNELYQIPVVSVEGLEHGTYTVEIGVYTETKYPDAFAHLNRGNEFHFDAVRIYDTAKGNKVAETEYKLDGEFAPNIQEVRDLLITKDQFTAASGKDGAVFLDPYGEGAQVGSYTETDVVATYKNQGPNNEVYLGYGQGIAFEIQSGTIPATVQIGAKSIDGNSATLNAYIGDANSTASATLTKNIATATDMYYELTADYAALFADGKTYVVVWNTGNNVLSITDIKIAYTTDPAETVVVSYSEEMATFASNLLVTAVEQDDPDMIVAKGDDGKYYYYVNGRVNEAYTGLVELDNGTWYVQDGQIIFNFDGAITFQGETYYIKAGRVSESTNGLYKYTGDWMYYTSGKVDTAYTGLAERNGMIVYVANGAVDFTKTGAVAHNGKLYYVRYGVADSSFTGLVRADDGAWVYVTAGQQDTAYTGIVAHGGSNWYVENGAVNFAFTGTVADANGNWTVTRGQATAANN